MNIGKVYNSKKLIILLLLGICLRIGEMDSLFSCGTPDGLIDVFSSTTMRFDSYDEYKQEIIHRDTIVQEFNNEVLHNRCSVVALKNLKKLYDRCVQRHQIFLCALHVCLQNLNDVSVILIKEVFQGLNSDLVIVDFIHLKDGKKSEIVFA